jgi:polysaccharide export outer membrane protein
MHRCTAFLLSIALVAGCARNRYPTAPTTPADDPTFSAPERIRPRGLDSDPPEALKLLPGDVIQLTTVSAQTQVFEGLIVDAMGQLHVPLAGDIQVAGLTLSQAEQAIEKGLRRYDRFVRANLIISTPDGHSASVLGQATTPGQYPVRPGMRLADLVAEAGGPAIAEVHQVPTVIGNLDLARLVRNGETVPGWRFRVTRSTTFASAPAISSTYPRSRARLSWSWAKLVSRSPWPTAKAFG